MVAADGAAPDRSTPAAGLAAAAGGTDPLGRSPAADFAARLRDTVAAIEELRSAQATLARAILVRADALGSARLAADLLAEARAAAETTLARAVSDALIYRRSSSATGPLPADSPPPLAKTADDLTDLRAAHDALRRDVEELRREVGRLHAAARPGPDWPPLPPPRPSRWRRSRHPDGG